MTAEKWEGAIGGRVQLVGGIRSKRQVIMGGGGRRLSGGGKIIGFTVKKRG